MTLTELKRQKGMDMMMRMHNAMYENYFGGDTLIVKNIYITNDHGIESLDLWFTSNELEFIERENVLDALKEHWNIEVVKGEKFEAVEWLFTEKK